VPYCAHLPAHRGRQRRREDLSAFPPPHLAFPLPGGGRPERQHFHGDTSRSLFYYTTSRHRRAPPPPTRQTTAAHAFGTTYLQTFHHPHPTPFSRTRLCAAGKTLPSQHTPRRAPLSGTRIYIYRAITMRAAFSAHLPAPRCTGSSFLTPRTDILNTTLPATVPHTSDLLPLPSHTKGAAHHCAQHFTPPHCTLAHGQGFLRYPHPCHTPTPPFCWHTPQAHRNAPGATHCTCGALAGFVLGRYGRQAFSLCQAVWTGRGCLHKQAAIVPSSHISSTVARHCVKLVGCRHYEPPRGLALLLALQPKTIPTRTCVL